MKRITFILALFVSIMSFADDVSFKASAPGQVIVGKPFQLTYTVNQRGKDLRAPEMADFEILAGPYSSTSSSISIVNGKQTSSFTMTFTYTLMAEKEGTYAIQPATIVVDHNTYNSNGLKITVLPADEQPSGNQGGNSYQSTQSQEPRSNGQQTSSGAGSNSDIFIKTIVNKTNVMEQECILLTYKLYTLVDIAQFGKVEFPDYNGFLKQELETDNNIQLQLEHYNGRNYQTAVLYQTLLFPQQTGDIKIAPAQFETIIRVRNRANVRSIFDDFFDTYTNVSKNITANGVTIHVKGLPSGRPAGFFGGVGRFNLTSSISNTELQTNDAVTLKIDISGSGNMKMLKTPVIDWPEGFEVYDPKVNNNFKNSQNGVSGTKSIEYLVIPRASGTYTIPSTTFAYYDTSEGAYKTLRTPEYTLHIAKGQGDDATAVGTYVPKEDIRQLGTDIRYIWSGDLTELTRNRIISFGSTSMWLLFILPLLVAIVLFIVMRKRIQENADVTRVKYKKANKVAQKRLKQAAALLKAQAGGKDCKAQFYEEIERAAWTYLSDRLSIPTANLNKENIAQLLREKKAGEDIISEVNSVLSTAEFARYAPAQSEHAMQDLYNQTANLIDKLEAIKL